MPALPAGGAWGRRETTVCQEAVDADAGKYRAQTVVDRARLRAYRKRLGLTQQQLAEAIGAYQQDISALECGRSTEVKTARLARLAAALGVPMERLLQRERMHEPPRRPR